jgi:hypothetical protein
MGDYEFTLRLEREITEAESSALRRACTDAKPQNEWHGTLVVFLRGAPSWAHALGSAVRDVEKVIGVRVVGADQEDLVTIRGIAVRARRAPGTVRIWAAGKSVAGDFPVSRAKDAMGEQYWSWREVRSWIRRHLNPAVDATTNEIRWADEVLRARYANYKARQALADADTDTRREFERLLDDRFQEISDPSPTKSAVVPQGSS